MPIDKASVYGKIEVLRTNTFLDKLSGIGGLPKGRVVEVWGETNSGKSTIALQALAEAQRQGLKCLLIDIERKIDVAYLRALGVDTDTLDMLKTGSAEDYVRETEEVVIAGTYDFILMDSIGSLSSRIEQEKNAGEKTIGIQASLMTRMMRIISPYLDVHKTVFIGISHAREDMNGKLYTLGGKKWAEQVALSIRIRNKFGANLIKQGDTIIGKVMIASATKNHVGATERKEVEAKIIFGEGFSASASLLDDAIDRNILEKRGQTYYFGEEKIGTIGKVREWVKEEENAARLTEALNG